MPVLRHKTTEDRFGEFADLKEWPRSRKGNRWRHWQGMTLTIFGRRDGYWGYVITDGDGPTYSPSGYESESEAIEMCFWALERRNEDMGE